MRQSARSSFSMQVAFIAVCGCRCLAAEALFTNRIQRPSGQITGLQIGSRQETKGFVWFLEARQRIVKVSVKHCLKTELVIVRLLFLLWGGGVVFLGVFLRVLQAPELLREWTTSYLRSSTHTHPSPLHRLAPLMVFDLVMCVPPCSLNSTSSAHQEKF